MRTPSVLADSSVRPSFLRTTPAKQPRTECCCQPVALVMTAIDMPSGRRKRSRTFCCFESARPFSELNFRTGPAFAGDLFVDRVLGFRLCLGLVIFGLLC